MTTRAFTLEEAPGGGHLVTWTGLLNGDDGTPFVGGAAADRSVHFSGTFGAGGTILLEGSNNKSSYLPLTDPQGNPISKTEESLEAVSEVVYKVRPRVTAGDGGTSLTASLFVKR
jgi:hypothetical protein